MQTQFKISEKSQVEAAVANINQLRIFVDPTAFAANSRNYVGYVELPLCKALNSPLLCSLKILGFDVDNKDNPELFSYSRQSEALKDSIKDADVLMLSHAGLAKLIAAGIRTPANRMVTANSARRGLFS